MTVVVNSKSMHCKNPKTAQRVNFPVCKLQTNKSQNRKNKTHQNVRGIEKEIQAISNKPK